MSFYHDIYVNFSKFHDISRALQEYSHFSRFSRLSGNPGLPMFMLVVVYLRALLNWRSLFTYVYVGCCVSQGSAELEVFVYLCLC